VSSPEELRPALARALQSARATSRPALIEVKVARGSEASPWPFIHPVKAY
jgi:acetolactate synthase I/II/III large subunit